jgi:hypothetical protein
MVACATGLGLFNLGCCFGFDAGEEEGPTRTKSQKPNKNENLKTDKQDIDTREKTLGTTTREKRTDLSSS